MLVRMQKSGALSCDRLVNAADPVPHLLDIFGLDYPCSTTEVEIGDCGFLILHWRAWFAWPRAHEAHKRRCRRLWQVQRTSSLLLARGSLQMLSFIRLQVVCYVSSFMPDLL